MADYRIWECAICGWVYDEAKGWPDDNIAAGTRWEDIPDDWLCPDCGVGKQDFEMVQLGTAAAKEEIPQTTEPPPVAVAADNNSYQVWQCLVCGWIYDEARGWPEDGIAPGTRWHDIPEDWLCPECGVGKQDFEMVAVSRSAVVIPADTPAAATASIDYQRKPLVIVGTGLAGYNLAREFRKLEQRTPLLMITADDGRFYSKPLISTGYHRNQSPEQMTTASAEQMAARLAADIRIFSRVERVDTAAHRLTFSHASGSQTELHYGKLVLATGARCIEAPLSGNALDQVYSINDLLDYTRFRTALVGRRKVLIIGAGLIGSEYANDLIQSNFQLEVVDALDSVLATLLPPSASASLRQALAARGIRFHFGTVVKSVAKHGQGIVATLGNGATIEADIVLSAIGVRPDLQLAKTMGLNCNRGIVTDRSLRTSVEDVFALGDCAEVDGHLLFYVAPLLESARCLASTLSGTEAEVRYGCLPVTIKTTLFPTVVCPPPKDAAGQWQVEVDAPGGVRALFRSPDKQLLGFALTGDCISARDELSRATQPVMAA